jgi:hypothetical protein
MAIKFFWMYVGGLFALSVVLLVLVKQFAGAFQSSGKKPVVYGTFSSVVASIAAYLSTLITDHLFTVFWIFSGIFLLFGILHMMIVHRKYFSTHADENRTKIFLAEVFFALSVIFFTIVVFSSLQYFIKDKGSNFLFYPMMMSTLTFFVPMLVSYTFEAAYSIPSPAYSTWYYPINSAIELPPDNPREKLLIIGFELSKKATDLKRTFFRAKAPEGIELGELFYHFINDYNELHPDTPIEYIGDEYEPSEWLFKMKRHWYQSQIILDPTLSMRDNSIVENTVIICERVS